MRELPLGKLVAVAALALVVGAVALVVRGGTDLPSRPTPIAWHDEACAHCRMSIGLPAHAAQLVTTSGEVLSFDDPGCALSYLTERAPAVHRLWFHDSASERWLSTDEVAFVAGGDTPMAFGLLAVARAERGARAVLSLDDAKAAVAAADARLGRRP